MPILNVTHFSWYIFWAWNIRSYLRTAEKHRKHQINVILATCRNGIMFQSLHWEHYRPPHKQKEWQAVSVQAPFSSPALCETIRFPVLTPNQQSWACTEVSSPQCEWFQKPQIFIKAPCLFLVLMLLKGRSYKSAEGWESHHVSPQLGNNARLRAVCAIMPGFYICFHVTYHFFFSLDTAV